MIEPGATLTLEIEKPAAGGRMLARHQGQVVLVWGGIPGEQLKARVERSGRGVIYAEMVEVVSASSDRRRGAADWRCGGNVYAAIAYPRQLQLKAQIIQDAFGRIGRVPLAVLPEVIGSPEQGYRMRARLHAQAGRLGFFREGTHHLCDAAATGQLLPETTAWINDAAQAIGRGSLDGVIGVELAEDVPGSTRVAHLELAAGTEAARFIGMAEGLSGLSAQAGDRSGAAVLAGQPDVTDVLRAGGASGATLTLRRNVRAFFQGNRFLVERLIAEVDARVPDGPVVDLYAGVGLFGLSLAAAGRRPVTVVEGDGISGADLAANAAPFGERVRVVRRSVEDFLGVTPAGRRHAVSAAAVPVPRDATFVVDPPRTGMSKDALAGIVRARPPRLVYVSCDVATLARDTRTLLDAGYELQDLTGIDLFPNTAHVESIAAFVRG